MIGLLNMFAGSVLGRAILFVGVPFARAESVLLDVQSALLAKFPQDRLLLGAGDTRVCT